MRGGREPNPAASGSAAAVASLPGKRLAPGPGRAARSPPPRPTATSLPARVATHPPGSHLAPPSVPGAWAPTCHGPLARGRGALQEKGGDSPPLSPLGVQGAPRGCAFQGSREACAGCGAPSLLLDWSPASNPSPWVGGYFQKKIPPLLRSEPSDGQGAYKSLFCRERGADGAAPGLQGPLPPQSRAPAPPTGPAPTLPRSPPPHALWPARGGGWAGPGLAALGRRQRRPKRRGGSSPAGETG